MEKSNPNNIPKFDLKSFSEKVMGLFNGVFEAFQIHFISRNGHQLLLSFSYFLENNSLKHYFSLCLSLRTTF